MSSEDTLRHVDTVLAAVDTFTEAVQHHEHRYHWQKLRAYAAGLFERAPFKVGDRVQILKTPEISSTVSWGWMRAKHFMLAGATASVRSVDFRDGKFILLLAFDDETWLDEKGVKHPITEAALYMFREDDVMITETP